MGEKNGEIPIEITELLARARFGDKAAESELYEQVYPKLHEIARQRLNSEGNAAESTESIIHECYLRLADSKLPELVNREHFFAIVSRLMRQILVDNARKRLAQRRDYRLTVAIDSIGEHPQATNSPIDLLAWNEALEALEAAAPQAARLVELRFFGGLTAEESADFLGMELATVRSQLRYGQSWLRRWILQAENAQN